MFALFAGVGRKRGRGGLKGGVRELKGGGRECIGGRGEAERGRGYMRLATRLVAEDHVFSLC